MGASKIPTPDGNETMKKQRKKCRKERFSVYINKILKQIHQDTGISKHSMTVMNSFITDIFERILLEASNLVRHNKKHTLSIREIQSSVKLLLPGELAKHANLEGIKAINKVYNDVDKTNESSS